MPHPIENILQTSMEQLNEMVDVNTVVGTPVHAGENTVILPISRVSLGFLSGGGEYAGAAGPVQRSGEALTPHPFAGAAVAGMSLTPMGFLCVHGESVRLFSTGSVTAAARAVDALPQALQMVENWAREAAKKKNAAE